MRIRLSVVGPGLNNETELDPAGSEIMIGRDPGGAVPLPDAQKHISRRHVAIRQVGTAAEIRVVSTGSGVDSSKGSLGPGDRATLADGDSFTVGEYRIGIRMVTSDVGRSPSPQASSLTDVFASLQGGRAAVPQRSDNPFEAFEIRPPVKAQIPSPHLGGHGEIPGGVPAERPRTGPLDELLQTGGVSRDPGRTGQPGGGDPWRVAKPSLDQWLSSGTNEVPIASGSRSSLETFLGAPVAPSARAFSPEHVRGANLQMPGGSGGPAPGPAPAASRGTIVSQVTSRSSRKTLETPLDEFGFERAAKPPVDEMPAASPPVADEASGMSEAPVEAVSTPAAPAAVDGRDLWPAFVKGLGLSGAQTLDAAGVENVGTMVRTIIEGLADLLSARADLKRELRAEDRTMLGRRDNNPLKAKLSGNELTQYLFSPYSNSGYMPAGRAIRESISELRIHEHATIAAVRAAVEGAIRDFEPGVLKLKLKPGKPGLFKILDDAKLWSAYETHYDRQTQHLADWLETVFTRHFMPTYTRETKNLQAEERGSRKGAAS